MTGLQVGDRQAAMGQADVTMWMRPQSDVVGAAMREQLVHHLEATFQLGHGLPAQVQNAGDATQESATRTRTETQSCTAARIDAVPAATASHPRVARWPARAR